MMMAEGANAMPERARIIAWWIYVLAVIIIFEVTFQAAGFAWAVLAALVSIAGLGIVLKLTVATLARRLARRGAASTQERAG
jgi:hypothetical protein